jgi:hypothetical protein
MVLRAVRAQAIQAYFYGEVALLLFDRQFYATTSASARNGASF